MRKLIHIRNILYKIKISYINNMDNTAEYERIFNMSIDERRKLLKEKDKDFKKEYFTYDNRERARKRRQAKQTENKEPVITDDFVKKLLNTPIQSDIELGKDGKLFKAKVDNFFKQITPSEPVKEPSPIIKEDQPIIKEDKLIIKEDQPIIKEDQPIIKEDQPVKTNKKEPVKKAPVKLEKIDEEIKPDDTFYQNIIYADTIIAKSYITDDGYDGEWGSNISNIKNYNIKIPIKYLDDIYINLPTNNSRMICDTQNVYIYFNYDIGIIK